MYRTNYSIEIAGVVSGFLEEDDTHFDFDDDKGIFRFGMQLPGQLKTANFLIDVREDEYIVYAVSPVGADAGNRRMMADVAEFLHRANYGLRNGCFELDFRDGEIRFRTYVDCDGDQLPTKEVIKNSIYAAASMMNRYGPGFLRVIYAGEEPKKAIEECEDPSAYHSLLTSALGEETPSADSDSSEEDSPDEDSSEQTTAQSRAAAVRSLRAFLESFDNEHPGNEEEEEDDDSDSEEGDTEDEEEGESDTTEGDDETDPSGSTGQED